MAHQGDPVAIRPEIRPYKVITNGSMIAGGLTSLVTIIQKISMVSYAFSWAGTSPVGTVSVQVSNDYAVDAQGNVQVSGTWNTLSFLAAGSYVTTLAVTGTTGNTYIDIPQTSAYAIRAIYTFTSGTGSLQATINGKVA